MMGFLFSPLNRDKVRTLTKRYPPVLVVLKVDQTDNVDAHPCECVVFWVGPSYWFPVRFPTSKPCKQGYQLKGKPSHVDGEGSSSRAVLVVAPGLRSGRRYVLRLGGVNPETTPAGPGRFFFWRGREVRWPVGQKGELKGG